MNTITLHLALIALLGSGLIHEEWELLDQYKFLSQLGVIRNSK